MKRLACSLLAAFASSAGAHCFETAAQRYGVSAELLRAVATVESGLEASAMNLGHRSRTGTYDIGLMQINSSWLPVLSRHGITEAALRSDPCLNANVGAWILADALRRHGNDWTGVGAYNASCSQLKGAQCADVRNRYAWRVYRALSGTRQPAPAQQLRIAVLTVPRESPAADPQSD